MATQAMPQGGLFGPSLDEYTQAQTQRDDQAAVNFAGMDDNQRNSYLMYKAGGMLMKPVMGALGYENTAESRIKKVQDISSKYDTTTADGLMQTAKAFNDAGMSREAQIALNKAREMQAAASKLTYEDAKTQRELAVAERALREPKSNEFPNLPPEVQAMMMLEKLPPESGAAKNIRAWLDTKAKGKGEWSDPYELGGATVQKNLTTGEIRTAVSRPPVTRVSVGGRGGEGQEKPMPPTVLKMQDALIGDLGVSSGLGLTFKSMKSKLEGGDLKLGFTRNTLNRVKQGLGVGTDESRALADFTADMEKMRNDSLRLNKGTQTEGDAQRAWNEIFGNMTDTKYVLDRLKKIESFNENALTEKQERINVLRSEYGKPELKLPATKRESEKPAQPTQRKTKSGIIYTVE